MTRWLRRVLLAALVIVVALALFLTYTIRASLPQLDGELAVAGITADVLIERDANGLTTVSAANRPDLAYALGFAHGQDRFFQMDLTRRQAAGELADILGAAVVDVDRQFRFHRFRARAKAVIEASSAADRAILSAYTKGVNAGLESLAARPFEYVLLRLAPQPWQEEDSLLVVYAMFMMLNDSEGYGDLARGFAHLAMPQALYDFMYPQGTRWDAPVMGEARATPRFPTADEFDLRELDIPTDQDPGELREDRSPLVPGSNNWAVSGELTDTGRAIVANDMHLGLSVPNVFYRARMILSGDSATELNGVTLPGTPILVAGSNGKVAWGFTNSYGDWTDIVVLQPGEVEGTYKTPSGDHSFVHFREKIQVRDAEPVVIDIRETIWGPVLDVSDYPDGELAVSWIAHRVDGLNLRQLKLESATTVHEAVAIANEMGIPPQNFVTGDAAGNIGWTIAGKIPRRADYDALRPADWSAHGGWIGWLDAADYPRIINPEGGRIWTANTRVVDGEALLKVGDGGYDLGARGRQIRDRLREQDSFVPADMLAIQMDDAAIFLASWRELLLAVLDDAALAENPARREFRDLVRDWLPRAAPESVGYRLVRAFRLEIRQRVFELLSTPVKTRFGSSARRSLSNQFEGSLWNLLNEKPAHLLPASYSSWEQLMLEAVDTNIAYFADNFDGGLQERTWGELNTARIQHPLSKAVPALSSWLDMPADQLTGDNNLPKAQGPSFGASERFAVSPGDEANGYFHIPAGPSGHPLSAFYSRGHQDWVQGRLSPFLPGPAAHMLQLRPATP